MRELVINKLTDYINGSVLIFLAVVPLLGSVAMLLWHAIAVLRLQMEFGPKFNSWFETLKKDEWASVVKEAFRRAS